MTQHSAASEKSRHRSSMGQAASLGLTQQDVEEVIAYCQGAWKQEEIEGLYKRFRSLDRGRKGYISGDEFMSIPELSINPIASRLVSPLHGAANCYGQDIGVTYYKHKAHCPTSHWFVV